MDKPIKFLLPPPNFGISAKEQIKPKPHFLTVSGMTLLPRDKQPPPMYGPRGATVPAKYLHKRNFHTNQQIHNAQQPPQEVIQAADRQYCEPCDMEVQTEEALKRHRAQHEPCPVDGCMFRGHPTVMDRHVMVLHSSGLFDKFKKLSTPEEIAAWRESRKKKYPTLANIKLRELAREQRERRGERLGANKNRFGKTEDRRRINNKNPNPNTGTDTNVQQPAKNEQQYNKRNKRTNRKREFAERRKTNEHQSNEAVGTKRPRGFVNEPEDNTPIEEIKKFKGTKHLKDYKHTQVQNKVEQNALTGLLSMYGSDISDSEYESDTADASETQKVKSEDDIGKEEISCTEVAETVDTISDDFRHENEESHDRNDLLKKMNLTERAAATLNEDEEHEDSRTKDVPTNIKMTDCTASTIDKPNKTEAMALNSEISEVSTVICNENDSSDGGPEEAPIAHTSNYIEPTPKLESSNSDMKANSINKHNATARSREPFQRKRKYGLDYRKARLRKQNTMLEKLLEPDIRHERNVLLQCVRFVCNSNFFGIGAKKDKETAT